MLPSLRIRSKQGPTAWIWFHPREKLCAKCLGIPGSMGLWKSGRRRQQPRECKAGVTPMKTPNPKSNLIPPTPTTSASLDQLEWGNVMGLLRMGVTLFTGCRPGLASKIWIPKQLSRVWLHCCTAWLPVKVWRENKSRDRYMDQTYQSKWATTILYKYLGLCFISSRKSRSLKNREQRIEVESDFHYWPMGKCPRNEKWIATNKVEK